MPICDVSSVEMYSMFIVIISQELLVSDSIHHKLFSISVSVQNCMYGSECTLINQGIAASAAFNFMAIIMNNIFMCYNGNSYHIT